MKPTLKDVAEKASVSMSTASLVLGGKGRIASATRKKVLESAELLGYATPRSKNGPSMESESGIIGILFNIDYEWAFIWILLQPIIYEIEKNLRRENFTALIIPITKEMSDEKILNKIQESSAQALLAMHYGNEALFITLEKTGIPVIIVMNNNFQDQFYSVCVDDYQGAYEGARHLIQLGHKTLAYIDTQRPNLPQLIIDRYIGFKKAVNEFELDFSDNYRLAYDPEREKEFLGSLSQLLSQTPAPTAIFCLDDELAAHVIVQLGKLGIQVPDDISIIAPGDVLDYSLPYIPQITTMRINTTLMGRITSNMLLSRIKHIEEDIHVLKVKQQLVQRDSCRELKQAAGETSRPD